MSEAVVSLRGVTKIYSTGEAEVRALNGVDLDLQSGEFVVILGPSGCGKSTLLNVTGGLDTPTDGTIVIDGQDIAQMSEAKLTGFRRRKIGFVFQFFNLVPTLTAAENVQLAAQLVKEPRDLQEVMQDVGLGERARHMPGQLSGGEQQRVAIARALVKNPPILLCDEPTGELDIETGRMILSLLRRVTHELGQTIMLVTHNAAIADMADRVLRLRDGKIVSDVSVAEPADPKDIEW